MQSDQHDRVPRVGEQIGCWTRAGHQITVAGRSQDKARLLAARLGGGARAATVGEAVAGVDAVLLAVAWEGVADILRSAGSVTGALAGTTLIDPTNAVDHGVGVLTTPPGGSSAQRVAELAPGAHVVKAFHLFPAEQWGDRADRPVTVAICGDDPNALRVTEFLVRGAGAEAAVLGGLDRARQLEEAAGFVIGLAFKGFDPRAAVPHVPASASAVA